MSKPAIKVYQTVCKHLGVKPVKITEKFKEVDGASLVIVPDQTFDYKKLIKLARQFGKDQPHETYVYEDLYKLYSAEELSGNPTGKKYRSLYIPHEFNVKYGTVAEQKKTKGHVPTVLEAITYWFVLREAGEVLDFDQTYIRHFDLPEKRFEDWSYVPGSYVYRAGQPYLRDSRVDIGDFGRLAVGSDLELEPSLEPSEAEAIKFLKDAGYTIMREY